MRPLTAEDEATLRGIAERHGFYSRAGTAYGRGQRQPAHRRAAHRRGRHARPHARRPPPPGRLARGSAINGTEMYDSGIRGGIKRV